MAKLTQVGRYSVELDGKELALVRRALQLVGNFGEMDDWDPARDLLADLEEVGE